MRQTVTTEMTSMMKMQDWYSYSARLDSIEIAMKADRHDSAVRHLAESFARFSSVDISLLQQKCSAKTYTRPSCALQTTAGLIRKAKITAWRSTKMNMTHACDCTLILWKNNANESLCNANLRMPGRSTVYRPRQLQQHRKTDKT